VLVSPCPTLEALRWGGEPLHPERGAERRGWRTVEIVDRRDEEPGRSGLVSSRVVDTLRSPGRILCVLNRVGRSRLLACTSCGELTCCERCDGLVSQLDDGILLCSRCGATRPVVCLHCGGTRLKNLRPGIRRVAEDLEALAGEPVEEVTAATDHEPTARIVVGTEAVLHRAGPADAVVFLDFDQELTATRYRGAEEALALLVLALRRVRGADPGRVVVQTRKPDHAVLLAAQRGDPDLARADFEAKRLALGWPPAVATARFSGAGAEDFRTALGDPAEIRIDGPRDGAWLIRAADHRSLCDLLTATPRPAERLRLEVDPLRA
jgi:primosomal protein N' (replication factor Y)